CGAPSGTKDHVVCRKFFPVAQRRNLPSVPACGRCNNQKSELERYATAVLPFGSRTPTAGAELTANGERRLRGNQKLHRELRAGQGRVWAKEGGLHVPVMTLPIEYEKIERLVRFIAIGLTFHHFGVRVPADYETRALPVAWDQETTWDAFLKQA